MNKTPLIIGIDPGTTVAFAAIDTKGNISKISSQKQLSYSNLITKLIELGKPLIIATDKKRIPDFIEKIAVKLGCRIIAPDQDLLVKEKKALVKTKSKNTHEFDAYSTALFALSKLKPIIKKVDVFVEQHQKENIRNNILELVIKEEIAIKTATYLLEHRDEPTNIVKQVVEERKINKKDFLTLYAQLKEKEKTISLLKQQNISLAEETNKANKKTPIDIPKKLKKNIEHKDNLIDGLNQRITFLETAIRNLSTDLTYSQKMLQNANSSVILKKLENLGASEYSFKNKHLNIQENDILLVDNPNIVSKKVIEKLKPLIQFVIYRNPPRKNLDLPFILLDAREFALNETNFLASIDKKEFEKVKNKAPILKDIIEQYRKERTNLPS